MLLSWALVACVHKAPPPSPHVDELEAILARATSRVLPASGLKATFHIDVRFREKGGSTKARARPQLRFSIPRPDSSVTPPKKTVEKSEKGEKAVRLRYSPVEVLRTKDFALYSPEAPRAGSHPPGARPRRGWGGAPPESGAPPATTRIGHAGAINAAAFSPDGQTLFMNVYGTAAEGSGFTAAITGPWRRGVL